MSELPKGWGNTKLERLLGFVIGGDWGKDLDIIDDDLMDVLCIRGTEFRHWPKEKRRTAVPRKVKASSLNKRKLELGDILVEISGGGPEQPVGRTVLIDEQAIVNAKNIPLVCTNFTRLARPIKNIDPAYLNFYLTKFYSSGEITKYQLGSNNLRNLQFKDYLQIDIPLAPLAEQKRIVAKLDEVLAQVDTIKARLDRIPAILKRFRQSVLAAAVSGKLTEDWRIGNYSEAWKALSIGDISTVATGKTPKRTNSEYWNAEDVPWLTSSATGNLFCYEAEQYVSHFAAEDCKLKLFPIGTLLLAMYGEGKTRGQVTELMFEATCNQACAAIMVDESKALKSYVRLRLLENYEETRKAAAGGNQPNLNLNKVREIAISLPSKNEQTEIVRLVDQYFAFADTIEAQVKKAQARVDNLTQSILAKAFRGELVAQDSNDEPAEKLLERIAQARKEAEALAKVAKKTEKQAVKQG